MRGALMRCCIYVVMTFIISAGLMGCKNDNQSAAAKPTCIAVPPTTRETDKGAAATLALKLEQLKMSADLKAEFKNTLKEEFQKLSDSNMSLYLFLSAIECYTKAQTPISDEMARELMQLVKARYTAGNQLAGTPPDRLTPVERNLINKNPEVAPQIFELFSKFGVQ